MSVWSLLVGILAICLVSATSSSEAGSTSYVFLQKFPLANTGGWIFHTEVLVCPQEGFSSEDQKYLDGSIAGLTDFAEIPTTWWSSRTANCIEFGYGGAPCTERCCGAPHKDPETHFPLNEKRAVIGNADTEQKSLYLYGNSGNKTGDFAYHALCDTSHETCWSNWAGVDYNPLTNNCNTFTSTILHCIYGLSEKKPKLGPSDMVTVTCDKCPINMNNSPTQDAGADTDPDPVSERMMLRHSSASSNAI